jgi:glycosyltransferase involved in cell wall biosynthesis
MRAKTTVIPNGIDLEEFDNNHLTRQQLLPEYVQHKWILNVSNFFPGKGQQYIPDILRRLPDKWNYIYLQISSDIEFDIGSQLENKWNKQCRLQLKDNKNISVHLLKNLPRDQVIGFFKNSNVFMFPTEKEVAPIVLLEAMAAELPWVAADVGNTPGLKGGRVISAIKDSRYHSVFDERVIRLFAQAAKNLLIQPSMEGREQVESMTWKEILPRYLSIIEK